MKLNTTGKFLLAGSMLAVFGPWLFVVLWVLIDHVVRQ